VHSRAHFRILGTPVRVEPLFLIIAMLFAVRIQQVWLIFTVAFLVFLSILVHEMGHALTYRFMGQRSAVVIHGMGGFTVPTGGGRRVLSRGKSIAVSLSGAIFQLVFLWLPARYLLQTDWAIDQLFSWDAGSNVDFNIYPVLYYMQFINLWWAVFNLLPIRPLDGGHVAEELFGHEWACKLSIGFAAVAAFLALTHTPMYLIVALLMGFFAYQNYKELTSGMPSDVLDVEAPDEPSRGGRRGGASRHPGAGTAGPAAGGGRAGRKDRKRRGDRKSRSRHLEAVPDLPTGPGPGSASDLEATIWNELRDGDRDRAAAMLRQSGSSNGFLQGSVALAQGHTSIALDLVHAAYMGEPDGPPNLVLATLLADNDQAVPLTDTLVSDGTTGLTAAASLLTHLHYAKRFEAAARVGELLFAAGPTSPAQTAFEVACAWSRAGNAEEGLRWVEAAIDAGFKAPAILDKEPDLLEVRDLPGWTAIRAKLD
jgi:stage IV sporulation protein FB